MCVVRRSVSGETSTPIDSPSNVSVHDDDFQKDKCSSPIKNPEEKNNKKSHHHTYDKQGRELVDGKVPEQYDGDNGELNPTPKYMKEIVHAMDWINLPLAVTIDHLIWPFVLYWQYTNGYGWGFWGWAKVLLLGYAKLAICTSAIYHRFFGHTAYYASRPVMFVLGLICSIGSQRGPLWWGSKHVRHHKYCENEKDPHSVYRYGLFYGFLGWVCHTHEMHTDFDFLPPVFKKWELIFVECISGFIPLLDFYFWYQYSGPNATLQAFYSTVLSTYFTLAFNVILHMGEDDIEQEEEETITKSKEEGGVDILGNTIKFSKSSDPNRARLRLMPWWFTRVSFGKPSEKEIAEQAKNQIRTNDGKRRCRAHDGAPLIMKYTLDLVGELYHHDHHKYPKKAFHPTNLIDLPYWTFIYPGECLGLFYKVNYLGADKNAATIAGKNRVEKKTKKNL